MKLIIDAMGGDNAPWAPVEAAAKAVSTIDELDIILVGKPDLISEELAKHSYPDGRIKIVEANDVISNHEEPAMAVRSRKDASIVVAARLLRDGGGDALLAMGNTGALLAAGLLIVGRIRGVLRPAIGTLLPTLNGPKMLIDAGANTNCKPENLVQFAVMGDIYMKRIMGIENPRVGILSNGEEEGKGDELTKETYQMLKDMKLNFIGNMEGRDIMEGNAEVFTCDGFVGNLILKTIEGMGSAVGKLIKGMFTKNLLTKLGALCVADGLSAFRSMLDYREYGGAPLLGTKKPLIKGHGSSDAKAVYSAIIQSKKFVEHHVVDEIVKNIQGMEEN